jgi:hypothetical protein
MKSIFALALAVVTPSLFTAQPDVGGDDSGFHLYEHIATLSARGMEERMAPASTQYEEFDQECNAIVAAAPDVDPDPAPAPEPTEELDPSGLYTVMVEGVNICLGTTTIEPTPQCISGFTHGGYLCDGTYSPGCGAETAVPGCFGSFTVAASCTSHDLCTSRWCTGAQGCTVQDNCTNGLCTTGDRCTVGRDCTAGPSCTGGTNCTAGTSCTALHCTNGSGCTRGASCTGGGKCTNGTNCTSGDCTKNSVCTSGTNCAHLTRGPVCTTGQYCTTKYRATCPTPIVGSEGGDALLFGGLPGSGSSLYLLAFAAIGVVASCFSYRPGA